MSGPTARRWKRGAWAPGTALCLFSTLSLAEESGLTLLSLCDPGESDFVVELSRKRECVGYISGILDANLYWKTIYQIDSWCFPEGERPERARLAAVSWLKENPGELHLPAVILLNRAFSEAFPCDD